jgi:hypothetical protein
VLLHVEEEADGLVPGLVASGLAPLGVKLFPSPPLRHSFGTDILRCSISVHGYFHRDMPKNQQLNSLIILAWKQAGLRTITQIP